MELGLYYYFSNYVVTYNIFYYNMPKKNRTKKKKLSTKKPVVPRPRVFMIIGHSNECEYINKDDEEMWNYVQELLHEKYTNMNGYFSSINTNSIKHTDQYIYYKQLEKNYGDYMEGERITCFVHPDRVGTFCKDCFDETNTGGYFWCNECIFDNHNKLSKRKKTEVDYDAYHGQTFSIFDTELDVKTDYNRINLLDDFNDIVPNNKIRFLNGQSSGRQGLTVTSFDIMKNIQTKQDFRDLIYNSKDMDDMKKIDTYLNRDWGYQIHNDNIDTSFSITPRINRDSRHITGPKNSYMSFTPTPYNSSAKIPEYLNGRSWPLGIFELPIFNINDPESVNKYNILFQNYMVDKNNNPIFNSHLPGWEFYSRIKNVPDYDVTFRSLLYEIPPNINNTPEEYQLESWETELDEITRYNAFLINKIMTDTTYEPYKQFLLSDIIRNTLLTANIKPNEEIIFISNACRTIVYPDYKNYGSMWNQIRGHDITERYTHGVHGASPPTRIHDIVKSRRRSSRGVGVEDFK